MEKPRSVVLVVCTPQESDISAAAASDALSLPSTKGKSWPLEVELLHVTNPLAALAVASKALIMPSRQLASTMLTSGEETHSAVVKPTLPDTTTVVLGHMSPRYLLLPTNPVRSLIEGLLEEVRQRHSGGSAVMLSLFAFPKEGLLNPISLVQSLASSTGLGSDTSRTSSPVPSSLDAFLPRNGLRFGRARLSHDPFVELRSIIEFDAMIDALFTSRTFERVQHTCSLQAVVATVTTDGGVSEEYPVEFRTLNSVWFLDRKHTEEFASTRTTHQHDVVERCVRHLQLPPHDALRCRAPAIRTVVVAAFRFDELLQYSTAVREMVLGTTATLSRYYAPVVTYVQPLSVEEAVANRLHHKHHLSRVDSLDHLSAPQVAPRDPGDARTMHNEALELQQKSALQRVGRQFDETEQQLQEAIKTLQRERDSLAVSKAALQKCRDELAAKEPERRAADDRRKELTLQLQDLKLEHQRLLQAFDTAQKDDARFNKERESAGAEAQAKRSEELRTQETEMRALLKTFAEEETRLRDTLTQQETATSRAGATQLAALHADLKSKQEDWRRREDVLTKAMTSLASLQPKIDEAKQTVRSKERTSELLDQQLKTAARLEYNTESMSAAAVANILQSQEARQESLVSEAKLMRETLVSKERQLDDFTDDLKRKKNDLDMLEHELEQSLSTAAAESDELKQYSRHMSLATVRTFNDLESYHRQEVYGYEVQRRCALVAEEMRGWGEALSAAETRFTAEAKLRCREEVFGIESRTKQLLAALELAQGKYNDIRSTISSTRQAHDALRGEMDDHLSALRDEENALQMFVQGHPSPLTGAAFPSLEEDEAYLKTCMERVRSALLKGAVILADEPTDKKRPRAPYAAQLAESLRSTVDEMMRNLERLVAHVRCEIEETTAVLIVAQEKQALAHDDLTARKEILAQVVEQTAELEKRLAEVHVSTTTTNSELVDRKRQQELLRQQLQNEFMDARQTGMQHRLEGQDHLRRLKAEEERLQQQLLHAQEGLRKLQEAKYATELRNPPSAVNALQLSIQREMTRCEELSRIVREAECVSASRSTAVASNITASSTPPPASRRPVVSPVPE